MKTQPLNQSMKTINPTIPALALLALTDSGAACVFTGLGPAAPQLAIEQSADNVRILWPLAAANFVLDETNDLNASPTIAWTQVPFPYQTNATDVAVTLPLAAGNKFYRLRKP